MMTSDNLMKLQGLFRELFQLDMADLDFGLYRLFNIKRQEIEDFLIKQLPKEVDETFRILSERDKADFREGLQKLEEQIRENLPPDTLLPNGDVKPAYRDAPVVKRYLDQKRRIERIEASEEQKADVFNHLFNFFSRYYDEGDFIPKRFYGSRESYAVPYNGEEVFFHWANKDQHYVKTGENFRDYNFKVEGLGVIYRLRFALTEATTPKDNTKGEYRYFFPQTEKISFDKKTKTLILPFEYRLPTVEEVQKYGAKTKGQDAILIEAVPKVMDAVPDDMLRDLLGEVVHKTDKEEVTLLLKRLRHFTRKNTTDYFIHKNLEGFLKQELEFYIKDQMLHLADIEADFDQKRLMLRVFRGLANTIITFLSQIEEVQRRLFEKKKFVLETNYCITLDRVPEELYPEIAANDAQREEWVKLFAIDEIKGNLIAPAYSKPLTVEFLKANPYLVLDTSVFDQSFTNKVVASFDNLDEKSDGLLVHGENFQALNLLRRRYHSNVKCIYLDPPYNTGQDGFPYKDTYQHSSWLEMLRERLICGADLLSSDGIHLVSIGNDEFDNLSLLLSGIFQDKGIPFVWKSRAKPTNTGDAIYRPQIVAEFVMMNSFDNKLTFYPLQSGEQRNYPNEDQYGRYRITTILTSNRGRYRRETMRFEIARYTPPKEKRWKAGPDEISRLYDNNRIGFGDDGEPHRKIYEDDEEEQHIPLWTFLPEDITGTAESGKSDLSAIMGGDHGLDSVKPKELIALFLNAAVSEGVVMDFFAGSGTTAEAVITMTREDSKKRQFVLVELADYFDRLLLPRVMRVIYSKDWKNGKPVSREGISHMFKYIRLESYEDALHNLASDGTMSRIKSKEKAYKAAKGENEYRIRYLARLPLESSDTMLNLARLEHPFDYTLEVLTDDGPHEKAVDLVETFNFLYGLSVRRLVTWKNEKDGRHYRIVKATDREGRKRILVVWRDMADLDPRIERKFLEGMLKEEDEFDEKLINGDTATPGFQSLDGLFKRLMEAV